MLPSMHVLYVGTSEVPGAVNAHKTVESQEKASDQFDIQVRADHVSSLENAFDRLQTEKFDAVLLDLGEDTTDNLYKIEELMNFLDEHGLRYSTPVIILSQDDNYKLTMDALKLGAKDCLCKHSLTPRRLIRSLTFATYHQLLPKKKSWFGLM